MKRSPRWVTKPVALAIHGMLLAAHGGAPGILDEGLLDAALASPRNRFEYEAADILQMAAAYAYAITQNHPFTDGNKRVALTVAGVFMELNGYRLEAPEHEAAQATRALAARQIDETEFWHWLRANSAKASAAKSKSARKPTSARARK